MKNISKQLLFTRGNKRCGFIIAIVCFFMLVNALGSAFGKPVFLSSVNDSRLGMIYASLNEHIKIFEDMFSKNGSFSQSDEESRVINNAPFALPAPFKYARKAKKGAFLLSDLNLQESSISSALFPDGYSPLIFYDTRGSCLLFGFKFLLLFLILFPAFPRGRPVLIRNIYKKNNKRLAMPASVFTVSGFSVFNGA
ncbi:MAG: hypothetical protein LBL00_05300 [Endomicrobium sp.]|jgi:hypothetical protein|nr:hypothetical protein [Endomicrobium sp.]